MKGERKKEDTSGELHNCIAGVCFLSPRRMTFEIRGGGKRKERQKKKMPLYIFCIPDDPFHADIIVLRAQMFNGVRTHRQQLQPRTRKAAITRETQTIREDMVKKK